jgi:hypothetical protein
MHTESAACSAYIFIQLQVCFTRCVLLAGDTSGGQLPPLLERLAFGWVKQRLGGRVRYMTTGDWTAATLLLPASLAAAVGSNG